MIPTMHHFSLAAGMQWLLECKADWLFRHTDNLDAAIAE